MGFHSQFRCESCHCSVSREEWEDNNGLCDDCLESDEDLPRSK
jgi:hypothetical protein